MFGPYPMHPDGGVNPPYSPAFPMEWDARIRTVEVMTRVEQAKVRELLAGTPFELVNDRVAFRFMLSPGHTLALWQREMFDLMVTVPVRYQDLYTQTHIYMYCSDPMGICAGRELFGYTKKDCTYTFQQDLPQRIDGSVTRRNEPLAEFSFTPDDQAPVVRLTDDEVLPSGEIHVRRLSHPARPEPVYADVVYRNFPLEYSEPLPGQVEFTLHASEYDPLADLKPEVLGAHFLSTEVFAGGFSTEDRRLLTQLIP